MLSSDDPGVRFDGEPESFSGRRHERVRDFPSVFDGILVDGFDSKDERADWFFFSYGRLVTRTIDELRFMIILNRQLLLGRNRPRLKNIEKNFKPILQHTILKTLLCIKRHLR